MWLADLLRTKALGRSTVKPQELVKLETDLVRRKADAAALEDAFALLGTKPDFEADQKRAKLRPQILAAREEIAGYEIVVAALREKLALVNDLEPIFRAKKPALIAQLEDIKRSTIVPDRPTMLRLWMDSRELEHLRRVLYDATGDSEFARPFDALDKLKEHWHLQHQERERVWTHHLSIPHRPTPPTPEWVPKAQRVAELHAAVKGVAV